MPEQCQRLRDINRPRAIGPLRRLLLGLLGLAMLSGCYIPPFRFNAEVKALTAEAAERFPVGSSAAEFEAWFTSKGGSRGIVEKDRETRKVEPSQQCEMRNLYLRRAEGCMNVLIANYCVEDTGKLASLTFGESGYC